MVVIDITDASEEGAVVTFDEATSLVDDGACVSFCALESPFGAKCNNE